MMVVGQLVSWLVNWLVGLKHSNKFAANANKYKQKPIIRGDTCYLVDSMILPSAGCQSALRYRQPLLTVHASQQERMTGRLQDIMKMNVIWIFTVNQACSRFASIKFIVIFGRLALFIAHSTNIHLVGGDNPSQKYMVNHRCNVCV